MITALCGGIRARVLLLLGVLAAALLAAGPASADQAIVSAGPLTSIEATSDLNCAVDHAGDGHGEFYGSPGGPYRDCGTFIFANGVGYGPDDIVAGSQVSALTAWTPVAQTFGGTGTQADPFRVVTAVTGGPLLVTQTDAYVVGDEQYTTTVQVQNTSATTAVTGVVYRAGDCYLQDNDHGLGLVNPATGRVACTALPESANPNRVEQWVPITPGSSFFEARYSDVWDWIVTGQAFPNTCLCADPVDNGAGLSWPLSLPPNGIAAFAHTTVFSPTGNRVNLTKTADAPMVAAGGETGYTITASNPNPSAATLTSILDVLPAGFSYVPGSTTGATTADPTITGQVLAWTGSFPLTTGGSLALHFKVRVASAPGRYDNNADGTAAGSTNVFATGPTATVLVASPPTVTGNPYVTQTLTCNPGGWPPEGQTGRTYQWTRNAAPLPGAVAGTYVPTAADVGTDIGCTETVGYGAVSYALASNLVRIVGPPANQVAPTVAGSPRPGNRLTCGTGQWTNSPTGYAFQWLRGGTPIAGARANTYLAGSLDADRDVTCRVTATNLAGSGTASSRAVRVAAVLASGPRDATLETGPNGSFRIQVVYTLRVSCKSPCRARGEIRTRSGKRVYSSAAKLPGDGKLVLGTRTGLKLPLRKQVRFYVTVSKAALLKAPFKTERGYRIAETRMRVWVTTPKGTVLTVRDGRIRVSIARIRSGALPGLRGVL